MLRAKSRKSHGRATQGAQSPGSKGLGMWPRRRARITGTQAVLLLEGKHTLTGRWSHVEKCQGTDKSGEFN